MSISVWETTLAKELSLIKDIDLRAKVINVLTNEISERHLRMPASSTGKYHPDFSNGEGGLVRHVKAVVLLVSELSRARPDMNPDILIAAAILHDFRKYEGVDPYTKHEHPATMAALCYQYGMPDVARLIESHMGIWTTAKNSKIVLPRPERDDEWLLHYADYIASRKWMKISFNEGGDIVQE